MPLLAYTIVLPARIEPGVTFGKTGTTEATTQFFSGELPVLEVLNISGGADFTSYAQLRTHQVFTILLYFLRP